MATLVGHAARITAPRTVVGRTFATKLEKKRGVDRKLPPKIDSSAEALRAKGFLRPQKSYTPPVDVENRLQTIFQAVLGGSNGDEAKINNDLTKKYELLTKCEREFDHAVTNSLLHTIRSLEDVKNYYTSPVDTTIPLDKMRNMELPENLHIQYDYHRFHPETDTKFGGQTAFNRSSTIVTGLKYKDKYKGHVQNEIWPYNS